jgi:CheY-like chemotaxis protein
MEHQTREILFVVCFASLHTPYWKQGRAVASRSPETLRIDHQADQMSSRSSDIDISSSRVLIADDIQQNRELLEAYLADEGYEILMASDGQQTMQLVDKHQPDLILLDIMMPRMSGYEVCSQIKGDPARRGIMVLIVTALNEAGDIEKAVNAGCDDFLTKPVNRLELRTRVRSLLRVRHLANERDRLLAYLEEMEHRVLRGDG